MKRNWYLGSGDSAKLHLLDRITVNAAGCFEWNLHRNKAGYGCVGNGRLAHRVSFRLFRREIPPGMNVCHRCDNPCCCNPAHLFLGTAADNNRDSHNKGRALVGSKHRSSKLTDKQVAEIRMLCAAGENQYGLAKKFRVTQSLISMIATRTIRKSQPGIAVNANERLSDVDETTIVEMRKSGNSYGQIAAHVDVCRATVWRILKRNGLVESRTESFRPRVS